MGIFLINNANQQVILLNFKEKKYPKLILKLKQRMNFVLVFKEVEKQQFQIKSLGKSETH
jgi:hypothetical protein